MMADSILHNEDIIPQEILNNLNSSDNQSNTARLRTLYNTIHGCYVPELKLSLDTPLQSEDFEGVKETCLLHLEAIQHDNHWLLSQSTHVDLSIIEDLVTRCILLYSQFLDPDAYWSGVECKRLAEEGITQYQQICKCENIHELLVAESNPDNKYNNLRGILPNILKIFSSKYTKKNWKCLPAYSHSYFWLLENVKEPHLAKHISFFLPPALFMLDDWEDVNKKQGIKALDIILTEMAGSKLRLYGRAEVIYEALKKIQFSRDASLLKELYPILIRAANIMDVDTCRKDMVITNLDHVLQHLLSEMDHEQRLDRRHVYAESLLLILEAMEIKALRWQKVIFNVFEQYLQSPDGIDGKDRINTLKSLEIFIKYCYPRICRYILDIFAMLLNFTYALCSEDKHITTDEAKQRIYEECRVVMSTLKTVHPSVVEKHYKKYKEIVHHSNLSIEVSEKVAFTLGERNTC